MISPEIATLIEKNLRELESKHDVRILFACESGSRAWGFHSKNSDYDVRFIYLQPTRNYLGVHAKRDVIEPPPSDPLDFSGWDVRKFLQLLLKSNPVAFEWLSSTIIYKETNVFFDLRPLARSCFSAKATMHHYLSMSRRNYREHMRDGQSPTVRLKKYLYITRPLLCCRWMEQKLFFGPPPMEFEKILMEDTLLHDDLRAALLDLANRKRSGEELEVGEAKPIINSFIDSELSRLREVADAAPVARPNVEALDEYFYQLCS